MFKSIKEDFATAEIIEKKSKFIANVFYVETEEEAEEKIKSIKKKYFDAKHNCFAYSVYSEEGVINRFSDDGEPSGTAGLPMLNIINGKKLSNVLVVVTRYFGGILLGTGGLLRAYTSAFQEALNKLTIINREIGLKAVVEIRYKDLEKAKYYFQCNQIEIVDSKYNENIELYIDIEKSKYEEIIKNLDNLNFKISNINTIKTKYITIK